jgi:HTH-type transcriptional regulator, sugar sensing transcriptional regulator
MQKISPKVLNLLGIKEKDMKVYLALLKLGTAPLRRIADEAGVHRATTYDALKRLMAVKLVSYLNAKSHRYFTAEDPKRIRALATQREVALQEAREEIDQVIPQMKQRLDWAKYRPVVRYYEGENGVKEILEDVLLHTKKAQKKTYRVYSSSAIRDLIAQAWPGFLKKRIRQGIHVRAVSIGTGGRTAGLDERKWLSEEVAAPTYTFLYAGKIAHVSLDEKKQLYGVVMEDDAIYQTQKRIFDQLWKRID